MGLGASDVFPDLAIRVWLCDSGATGKGAVQLAELTKTTIVPVVNMGWEEIYGYPSYMSEWAHPESF